MDLFEAQVQAEAEKLAVQIAEQRLSEVISDPQKILDLWKKDREKLEPLARKYQEFLDSDGYIDAAQASAIIKIEYTDPSGIKRIMGRNYFLQVLEEDGIVMKTPVGYRLYKKYEGKMGVSRVVVRGGYTKAVTLFTPQGIDKLHDRYDTDGRVWVSTGEGLEWRPA